MANNCCFLCDKQCIVLSLQTFVAYFLQFQSFLFGKLFLGRLSLWVGNRNV